MQTRPPDAFSPGRTPTFEESAKESLDDAQLRRNLGKATQTIRRKRTVAVEEMPDWEELREAGRALKSCATSTSTSCNSRSPSRGPAGRSTGPAMPMRPTASSPG
jgi:hypothetical protein